MKTLIQYGWSAGRVLNPGPSKHKAGVSLTRPQRSAYKSYSSGQLSYAALFGGVSSFTAVSFNESLQSLSRRSRQFLFQSSC